MKKKKITVTASESGLYTMPEMNVIKFETAFRFMVGSQIDGDSNENILNGGDLSDDF